jgi:hypothetical protein
MTTSLGLDLLQSVAERIVIAYLNSTGAEHVEGIGAPVSAHGVGVDIVVLQGSENRRLKLKADPYYGTDSRKVADRSLSFYRSDAGSYAFEAIANTATREPGWTLASDADDLYYYYLALAQSPEDVQALMSEREEVFLSELLVERDELVILPMQPVREWFETHHPEYTPRPVMHGDGASWYRLVPRQDVERAVTGIRTVGSIFAALAR